MIKDEKIISPADGDENSTVGANTKLWKMVAYICIALFVVVCLLFAQRVRTYFEKKADLIHEENASSTVEELELEKQCENCVPRMIDGILVESGTEASVPIAVVIDNHYIARPAEGLSRASLVYEAEAEGGITRYLAIFDSSEDIEKIGPIRSARPYFVDWTAELGAVYAHCGGSPDALVRVLQENVLDGDEYYNGEYYWRNQNLSSPNNIFSSSQLMREFLQVRNRERALFDPWLFKTDDKIISDISMLSLVVLSDHLVRINFKPGYEVEWRYDVVVNNYQRYLSDERHTDASGAEINAKNVIIAFSDFVVLDEALRLKIRTTGEGKALICLDGSCTDAVWKKKSAKDRLRFFDEAGEEIKFNPGTTWVEFIDKNRTGYEIVD